MKIVSASEVLRKDALALLRNNQLPADDLPAVLDEFYVALENERVIGLVGMERYGRCSLLRSFVVDENFRGLGIADLLLRRAEEGVRAKGATTIYLLTETAEKYFLKKGYKKITRAEVPEGVQGSSEFSHVCPASATVMKKQIFETVTNI